MRSILKIALLVIGLFIATSAVHAESIPDYSAELAIRRDGSVSVSEIIRYDFGTEERHGIYRDIPYRYKARGGNFELGIDEVTVMDENGNAVPFSQEKKGADIRLKIGDPDATITGAHTYSIGYRVTGAINFFDERDELYWNVNGNGWKQTITQIKATVDLPMAVAEDQVLAACYAGPLGSANPCVSTRYDYSTTSMVRAVVFTHDTLRGGEGMTVAVSVPKGVIAAPTVFDTIRRAIAQNWILVLPFLVFAFMYRLWQKRGRDPRGRGTIIAQYDAPADLTPAEVGALVDESVSDKDVSAELISLAVRGYITITKKPGGLLKKDDYELTKLKDGADLKAEHDRLLLDAFFKDGKTTINLSDLKEKFAADLAKVRSTVYDALVRRGYFDRDPNRVRMTYIIIGVAVLIAGLVGAKLSGWYYAVAGILSGAFVMIFGYYMPRKTTTGVLAREHILGLKTYLSVAEKDRLEFHNAPEKSPALFEKLLPYAMALGVTAIWAKQFEGIYRQNPSWWNDPSGNAFVPAAFASDLGGFQSHAGSVMSATAAQGGSGSGGGGFSGGGFGGGGGGSW